MYEKGIFFSLFGIIVASKFQVGAEPSVAIMVFPVQWSKSPWIFAGVLPNFIELLAKADDTQNVVCFIIWRSSMLRITRASVPDEKPLGRERSIKTS